ncbi:hypothetical protein EG829_27045, partial [bacterium]|nr:hypothetical protein [bacterium]
MPVEDKTNNMAVFFDFGDVALAESDGWVCPFAVNNGPLRPTRQGMIMVKNGSCRRARDQAHQQVKYET